MKKKILLMIFPIFCSNLLAQDMGSQAISEDEKLLLWGFGIFLILGLITVFWSISLAKKGKVIIFPSKKSLTLFIIPFIAAVALLIVALINKEQSETFYQILLIIGICVTACCLIGELIWTIIANVRNHSNPFYVIVALIAKLYILLVLLHCLLMLWSANDLEKKRTKYVTRRNGQRYEVKLTKQEILDNQEKAREIRLRYSAIMAAILAVAFYTSHVQKHSQRKRIRNRINETTMEEIFYPESERELCSRLKELQDEWRTVCGYNCSEFVYDGFYPFYTQQKVKILFIGRENRDLDGECGSYISQLFDAYKKNSIGGKSINTYKTHSLQFYITYGLNNNLVDWSKIPSANELIDDFATEKGISWAYMNLSKLSNTSKHSQVADFDLINSFCEATQKSGRNFWAEEINMLNPDLIIGMNLGSYYDNLGVSELGDLFGESAVRLRKIKIGMKMYPLLDTYHFSAMKSPQKDFYDPIVEAFKNIN